MIIQERILLLRRMRGWSQEELAERIGVSRQAVSKWESGGALPDVDRILMLAEVFGVSTDYLLREEAECATATEGTGHPCNEFRSAEGEISLTDTEHYLSDCHTSARLCAVGAFLMLLSPVPLLLFILIDSTLALLAGAPLLILCVVTGIVLTSVGAARRGRWRYIYLSDFSLSASAGTFLNSYQKKYGRRRRALCILSAVALLAAIAPLIPMSLIGGEAVNAICISAFLLLLSVSIYAFVFSRLAYGSAIRLKRLGQPPQARGEGD